jgi:hypothetical protein
MARDAEQGRPGTPEVHGRQPRASDDLVAEHARGHQRVGGAARRAQQRDVVDLAQLRFVETQFLAQPHAEHAGAQRELERLPDTEVRRERQGGDELRQPDARRRVPVVVLSPRERSGGCSARGGRA